MKFASVLSLILAARALTAAPATYDIDSSHASAQFTVRHLMISNVKGSFQKVTGRVIWDPGNLAVSKLDATIDVNSVNTLEPKRDAHLKSPDFFDVAKFPTLTFRSTKFSKSGNGLLITGDLTIRGVTKQVTFTVDGPTPEVKDPWGNSRLGAAATATINRKDFGLTWNAALETGGVVVGDEVKITLEAELIRKVDGKSSN